MTLRQYQCELTLNAEGRLLLPKLPSCVSMGTLVSDGPVSNTYDLMLNFSLPKLVEVKLINF